MAFHIEADKGMNDNVNVKNDIGIKRENWKELEEEEEEEVF